MIRKACAFVLFVPLLLFFFTNGTFLSETDKTIFEAGTEIVTNIQKVNYLLPDNELQLPENEMFFTPRKYIKDTHKYCGKRFVR